MRAPINERKEFKSIGLPPRLWEFAKTVGQGQYANGIRYIVELTYKQEQLCTTQVSSHPGADCKGTEG